MVVAALGCESTPYREVEVDLAAASGEQHSAKASSRYRDFHFSVAAMLSPRSTYYAYSQLLARVGELLGVEVEFVQRRTYREVNNLMLEGRIDAALLCTGGYLALLRQAPAGTEVIAVPVVGGKTTYQSFIIVPAASPAAVIQDLAGKRFAFTDELSLSGHAYAIHILRRLGQEPHRFFAQVMFTQSHDRSIDAVANGMADGAAVDSLVYENFTAQDPTRAAKIRVIDRSPPFGMIPVVAAPSLSKSMRSRLRDVLVSLHEDPAAAAALRVLRIERFVVPEPGLYDAAAAVMESVK
jgi:phosphonate transport system substrate-binding protein